MWWPIRLGVLLCALQVFSAPTDENAIPSISQTNSTILSVNETSIGSEPSNSSLGTADNNEIDAATVTPTTLLPSTVRPKVPLGANCANITDCWGDNIVCRLGVCSCEDGYFRSKKADACYKIINEYEGDCSHDEECRRGLQEVVGSTSCINFKCQCSVGLTLIDRVCKPKPELWSPCNTSHECKAVEFSQCQEGICGCKKGYVEGHLNNSCIPVPASKFMAVRGENLSCVEDVQCQQISGEFGMCNTESGTCSCRPGSHFVSEKCKAFKKLGDECINDNDCISPHETVEKETYRYCNQSICSCNSGYIQKGEDRCVGGSATFMPSISLLIVLIFFTMEQNIFK